MNILLDTHTLLWAIGKSDELSENVIAAIENKKNKVFVSAVSLWEISLKSSIGKLKLSFPVVKIPDYCKEMEFTLLPFKKEHKDPFDRQLIYECIKYKWVFASRDDKMSLYKDDGLNLVW